MAFSFVRLKKTIEEGGLVVEEGTFNLDGVTTGNITADTSAAPKMVKIREHFTSSNGDLAIAEALDVAATTLKITGTSGDTGTYTIKGKSA